MFIIIIIHVILNVAQINYHNWQRELFACGERKAVGPPQLNPSYTAE